MSDIGSLTELMEQGDRARALLEDPMFRRIAEDLNRENAKAFKGDDMEVALKARDEARAFERILTKLKGIETKGRQASKELDELRQRKDQGLSLAPTMINGIA